MDQEAHPLGRVSHSYRRVRRALWWGHRDRWWGGRGNAGEGEYCLQPAQDAHKLQKLPWVGQWQMRWVWEGRQILHMPVVQRNKLQILQWQREAYEKAQLEPVVLHIWPGVCLLPHNLRVPEWVHLYQRLPDEVRPEEEGRVRAGWGQVGQSDQQVLFYMIDGHS